MISFLCVFHLESENELMPWMRWPFQGNSARQGGRVERCTLGTGCIADPKLGVNISPFDQVLPKCKVELQILQVNGIKEALGLY